MMESRHQWVALLRQRDTSTDGIEEYCSFLACALAELGMISSKHACNGWKRIGLPLLGSFSRASSEWRGPCVLLQYTASSWSRRGFPFGALAALAILRQAGVRCTVVFHENTPRSKISTRRIDHTREVPRP